MQTFILAGIAAATTLAEIAIIKSQKVPRFGTGKAKGEAVPGSGLAIVDDGGKREPIVRADGSIEYASGPAQDRLTYLHQNDQVFTSLEDFMKRFVMPKMEVPALLPIMAAATAYHHQVAQVVEGISGSRGFAGSGMSDAEMKKLAGYMAAEMKGFVQGDQTVHFNIDENGFRVYQQKANEQTEFLNKRYLME